MEKNINKFNKDLNKEFNYDQYRDKGYNLEVDVEYPKNLLNVHGDLPFLAERNLKKCNKLVCSINEKEKYVFHVRAPKKH